ncbi:MAG: beta-galactosidase [Lentisphaeria bacterium]|jgi:hypothetical protein
MIANHRVSMSNVHFSLYRSCHCGLVALCLLAGATAGLMSARGQDDAGNIRRTTLFDGGGPANRWRTNRDQHRLTSEFSQAEHHLGDNSLMWRFTPRAETRFNDLFYYQPIPGPFSVLRFRVRNHGRPFNIAAKFADSAGVEWTVPSQNLPSISAAEREAGAWQEVLFPWHQWQVASWAGVKAEAISFPTQFICVIAFGVEGGKDYQLEIGEIVLEDINVSVSSVGAHELPTQGRAEERLSMTPFTLRLNSPLHKPQGTLRLDGGHTSFTRVNLALQMVADDPRSYLVSMPEALVIPKYIRSNSYDLTIYIEGDADDGQRAFASQCLQRIAIQQRPGKAQPSRAHVATHNGVPTLFIDDQAHDGMACAAYRPSPEKFAAFTSVEVDLFSICGTPTDSGYGLSKLSWLSEDVYDFSQLDHRVQMILTANPDAHIFPRLYLHAPAWWSEKHPDELVVYEKPDGTRELFIHRGEKPAPSWSSRIWREDTVKGLAKLIEYVESSPYADNFIGYHIASGTTEEWMMWGANENQWVDYSPANLAYFREWLSNKYGSDQALQKAWNNPTVTLANAELPTYAQRNTTAIGSFRDPRQEQQVIDFYTYNSWLVADTLSHLAAAVKKLTRGQKTVGVFYGYLLQLCGGQRLQNAGHLALEQVLNDPNIDFVCSPTSYAFRQHGGLGTCHFMSLVDSVKLHGKLWFNENDVRTSLSPGKPGTWGRAKDVPGDIIQQDKELACVIGNGVAQWWFDVGANRYDHPDLLAALRRQDRVARSVLRLDRSPVEQVALVVDPESLCYLKVGDVLGAEQLIRRLPTLHRSGRPVGHFLASDLAALQRQRLLIMACSFAPSAKQRADLEKLKSDGRIIVFLNGAGLYSNGVFDPEAMQDFTGIRIRMDEEPAKGGGSFRHVPGFTDALAGQSFGAESYVQNPALLPDDSAAVVLASYADGRPAVAAKRFPTWTAVYCAQPQLPAAFWRQLADLAGAHCYVAGEDVIWASKSLVAISVHDAGERSIELPAPARVRELYSNTVVSDKAVSRFTWNFSQDSSCIFELTPEP